MVKKTKQTAALLSADETVYDFIKKRILGLNIKPGETININELVNFLNVSRSPIRDALLRLEKDGLVTATPKKGTIVSQINSIRVQDERFMRACIEVKVAAEFLERHTDADLARMEKMIEAQSKAAHQGDTRAFLEFDDMMHAIMFDVTNHLFSLEAVQNMSGHYSRMRLLSLADNGIMQKTLHEHKELIALIRRGDSSELTNLLNEHITEKGAEIQTLLARYPDLFEKDMQFKKDDFNMWEGDFLKSRV